MLNVIIDDRNGMLAGSSGICAVCCCPPIFMRPGETNLMVLSYAPWSVPLGGLGIVPTTEISIERDSSLCSVAVIDTFGPPANTSYNLPVVADTATPIDLTTNEDPAGNTFEYHVVPLFGPQHGLLTAMPLNGVAWEYTPNNGFVGWDYFYYTMTDAQGRFATYAVKLAIGAPTTVQPVGNGRLGLYIDPTRIRIDQRMQQIAFAMYLAPDARQCDVFKVNIKQPAQSCDDTFYNLSCFEVHVGKC